MTPIPGWVALLLAFWMGSITGFVLAVVVTSRMNTFRSEGENNDER